MKNLFRMHIHTNRMDAIRDSEVKQLFLNVKLRANFAPPPLDLFLCTHLIKLKSKYMILYMANMVKIKKKTHQMFKQICDNRFQGLN